MSELPDDDYRDLMASIFAVANVIAKNNGPPAERAEMAYREAQAMVDERAKYRGKK